MTILRRTRLLKARRPLAAHHAPTKAYRWIDGVESLDLYKPGGLHPVIMGGILNSRYEIVDKLGHGGYSTVWLALDRQGKSYVALKIGLSDPSIPRRDVAIMKSLPSHLVPNILDQFEVEGPNGVHPCYTTIPTQASLAEVKFNSVFPVKTCRVLAARMMLAVAHAHSRGFAHGDLHLQNFLVKTPLDLDCLTIQELRTRFGTPHLEPIHRLDGKPLTSHVPSHATTAVDLLGKRARDLSPEDAKGLLLNDFGESWRPDCEDRLGVDSRTPLPGRPPEALFEPQTPLSFSSDVWTLATSIWLMLGMKPLFSDLHFSHGELVGEQINSLGYENLPERWRTTWESKPINENDELPRKSTADVEDGWPPPLRRAWVENQRYRNEVPTVGEFGEEEAQAIYELLRELLCLDPQKRPTMDMVLELRWLKEWALPELSNMS